VTTAPVAAEYPPVTAGELKTVNIEAVSVAAEVNPSVTLPPAIPIPVNFKLDVGGAAPAWIR
jgi:hypothetical protein